MKKSFSIFVLLTIGFALLSLTPVAAADECNGIVDKGCTQTSCDVIWHRDTWPDGYSEWNYEEGCSSRHCKLWLEECIGG